MIHAMAPSMKFIGDPPIAITFKFSLDLLDQLHEFGVRDCRAFRRGAIIESASRQSHCFASPSDGASRGPVMMEDVSLLFAVNGRGVFLTRSSSIVSWPTVASEVVVEIF